jgi:hypothetical protein
MSAKSNKSTFEKFPEPRTIPEKWNTAGMMSAKKLTGPVEAYDPDRMETFPEPRTIPDKWDVSGMTK